MLKPIRTYSIIDEVIIQLKNLILEGTLRPGDQFPAEKDLCEQLNVSRTVIREAKQALIGMGMLEAVGKRTYVREDIFDALLESISFGIQLERGSMEELIEARRIIEVESAGLAAERASKEIVEKLQDFIKQQKIAIRNKSTADFIKSDLDWHTTIAEATRNRVVARMVSTFRNMLEVLIMASLNIPQSDKRALNAHRRITEAIAAHDPEEARNAMNDHLNQVQHSILAQIKKEGVDQN